MKVYCVVNAHNGVTQSVWSTAELANENRNSLEHLLDYTGMKFTVLVYTVDAINEWETYYD